MTASSIRLNSGRLVDLCKPRPEDVTLADVSHHLSQLCRFTGGTAHFYSVAEHAVRLSEIVPPRLALAALHHDDHEFVLGDISSPLKALLNARTKGYLDFLAHQWDEVIAAVFRLEPLTPADVAELHTYDVELRKAEATLLMKGSTDRPLDRNLIIRPPMLTPTQAAAEFCCRHWDLGGAR